MFVNLFNCLLATHENGPNRLQAIVLTSAPESDSRLSSRGVELNFKGVERPLRVAALHLRAVEPVFTKDRICFQQELNRFKEELKCVYKGIALR